MLELKNLKVSIDSKEILKGLDLTIRPGELHVLMGPNGSGKSTLAQVIAGHPSYTTDKGQLTFDNKDIRELSPDKRAKMGIFLGFQHPIEVPGVSVFNFLRRANQARSSAHLRGVQGRSKAHLEGEAGNLARFRQELLEYASSLNLGADFLRRSVNEGFSGGEKKRNEILQMMALRPKLAILDEIDSGLDVDGLRIVAQAIQKFSIRNSQSSILLITHYARILKYLKPDFVHVMVEGRIVKSGKMSLAREIETRGYQSLNF